MLFVMTQLTRFEALQQALAIVGTQQAFADLLGVSQPKVWRWVHQSKQLPAEFVLKVEAATGVSRHDLRPDIYPRELMIDQGVGARFIGIDHRAGNRRQYDRRAKQRRAAGV